MLIRTGIDPVYSWGGDVNDIQMVECESLRPAAACLWLPLYKHVLIAYFGLYLSYVKASYWDALLHGSNTCLYGRMGEYIFFELSVDELMPRFVLLKLSKPPFSSHITFYRATNIGISTIVPSPIYQLVV